MSEQTDSKPKSFTYHAKNIKWGNGLKEDKNGNNYMTGTFEYEKDGQTKVMVFKAFDRKFPDSGKELTPAKSMFEKLGETREGYLRGTFQPGRKDFKDFHVAFVDTVAEREAFVEAQKAQKAKKAQGGEER